MLVTGFIIKWQRFPFCGRIGYKETFPMGPDSTAFWEEIQNLCFEDREIDRKVPSIRLGILKLVEIPKICLTTQNPMERKEISEKVKFEDLDYNENNVQEKT